MSHYFQMFFVDVLDNLPRMRHSDAQMRMILFIMKETGSRDVPSLRALRKFLLALLTSCLYPSPICLATTLAPNSTCNHGLGSLTLSWRDRIHGYLGLCPRRVSRLRGSSSRTMRMYPYASSVGQTFPYISQNRAPASE